MLSCCLKCRKNTNCKNERVEKTYKGIKKLLSICSVFGSKNREEIKKQEVC